MTLSIMWRSEGRIHLASDSRISFGMAGQVDVGVKVMRLPIRVFGTDLDDNGYHNVIFNGEYGFCFAGSLANAATFKDLIEDLLLNVQYVSHENSFSFGDICEFLCRFSGKVSTEIVSRMAQGGIYTFFITGLCPRTQRMLGAKFCLTQNAGIATASYEECIHSDGEYIAIGSGGERFDVLMKGCPVNMHSVLLTLNEIIDEESIESVGGDIQYGSFVKDMSFSVSGVTRISQEHVTIDGVEFGPTEMRIMKYRGFELYAGWGVAGDKFWPSPNFIELNVPSNRTSNQRFIDECRKITSGGV